MTATADPFDDDARISWYRSPIDRDLLGELMRRSDLRGWLQTGGHLGAYLATGTLAYVAFVNVDGGNWYWSVPVLLVALFVHGTLGQFTLPKLRRAIEHDLPPATHGLRDTWREMLAIRARAIADPAYRHAPAIPAGRA